MRKSDEREIKDNQTIKDFLLKMGNDYGEKNVTTRQKEDGTLVIEISNAYNKLCRKEHQMPEYLRKDGD